MIYFAQLPTGTIKIGFSDNVEHRIYTLGKIYGHELSLLFVMKGNRKTEREIHERFAHLRFGFKEQFKPGPDLMEFIGKPLLVNANSKAVETKKRTSPYPGNGRPRKHFSKVFAVDSETISRLKLIKSEIPEIESLSAAIRYASRIAIKHLPKKPTS